MEETLSRAMLDALDARHLDWEIASAHGLHSRVGKGGGEALVIPFLREGRVVNRKFRTLGGEKRFWQDKDGVQCFWNEDCLRDDSLTDHPLIITEGEMDALAALTAGFKRVVSVPCGAPDKPVPEGSTKYSFLDDVKSLLSVERVSRIILAVDGDGPGQTLMHDLALRLGKFRCQWLTYPKDPADPDRRLKDLNEVLIAYGPPGVDKTISRAQWMKVEGVFRMSELPPVPDAPVYDIGMPDLRNRYKMRLGDFAVWTGIPSHGKSSLVNDMICRVVQAHGLSAAFASFEQNPQRDHRRNLRTWFCGKPVEHCTSGELAKADDWIDRHFAFLVPGEDEDVDLEWVLDRLEAAVIQHGCKIVVVDPWNEMDHCRRQGESLTEYTGRAIKALKRFAKKLLVHLIVVAHPSKQSKDENGAYRVPTLYDISDSAHWYNKADLGVVVHRYQTHTLIRVAKSRYHDLIGEPGDCEATFEFTERRYEFR
jgi:twinkle protein